MATSEIWKFPLRQAEETWLVIPEGYQALSAQYQDGVLCLWALVNPSAPTIQSKVLIVGTGWSREMDGWAYLSTVQSGPFVWHVFVPAEHS